MKIIIAFIWGTLFGASAMSLLFSTPPFTPIMALPISIVVSTIVCVIGYPIYWAETQ